MRLTDGILKDILIKAQKNPGGGSINEESKGGARGTTGSGLNGGKRGSRIGVLSAAAEQEGLASVAADGRHACRHRQPRCEAGRCEHGHRSGFEYLRSARGVLHAERCYPDHDSHKPPGCPGRYDAERTGGRRRHLRLQCAKRGGSGCGSELREKPCGTL